MLVSIAITSAAVGVACSGGVTLSLAPAARRRAAILAA
jgi:hypothetical protein